jgi:hypothetical protein
MGTRFTRRSTDFTLREHAYDGVVHAYRKRALADGTEWLIPWCSEDTAYPDRHHRDDLALMLGGDWCPACIERRAGA